MSYDIHLKQLDARNMSGFIPPFLLNNIIRLNAADDPKLVRICAQTLADTALLWSRAQDQVFPIGSGHASRYVYDAHHRTSLPGTLARQEGGDPVTDVIVNNGYDYSGSVRDFLSKVLHRNGIDGSGGRLITSVHYGNRYNNAFWNGRQMTYGDGDGKIFKTFVLIDVNGHEMFHGVTENTSGLEYYGQPGALNEHASDVFGELIEQWTLGHKAGDADWLVGKGLFTDRINGVALRSMLNPGSAYDDPRLGKDPQPDHMDDFVDTWSDNGGVHINSGIPNKAFALFAVEVGGYAWEKCGKIWYNAIIEVSRKAKFQEFANMTVKVADANFSETTPALKHAWKQVGITAR